MTVAANHHRDRRPRIRRAHLGLGAALLATMSVSGIVAGHTATIAAGGQLFAIPILSEAMFESVGTAVPQANQSFASMPDEEDNEDVIHFASFAWPPLAIGTRPRPWAGCRWGGCRQLALTGLSR
jgi:hypothetical protein